MKIRERLLFANVVLLGALCTCSSGGGKRTIDVESFSASGCKMETSDAGASTALASPGAEMCVSWTIQPDGSVAVALTDFAELCGTPTSLWTAAAREDSASKISISIEWAFKTPNACGLCAQDYSLRLIGIQAELIKTLDISTRGCSGQCEWRKYELDLSSVSAVAGASLCGDSVRRI